MRVRGRPRTACWVGLSLLACVACTEHGGARANTAGPSARPAGPPPRALRLAATGRYLVLLDGDRAVPSVRGAAVTRSFSLAPALAMRVDPAALSALAAHPWVRAIDPDEGGTGQLRQAQALVGLDAVRGAGFRGAGVTIAVIDSGVDATHPDLAGRVVDEACFCGSNCCPGGGTTQTGPGSAHDDHGHGTHVAATIASQGSVAAQGGTPDVSIVAVKVLTSNLGFCCMSDVVAALDWIAGHHPEVDVVNISLGTGPPNLYAGDCDGLNTVLGMTIDQLRAAGTLVVAAAGNNASTTAMAAPACIANAISVGAVWDGDVGEQTEYCEDATTMADQVACYSNASSTTDVLAPGGVIEASWPGGGTLAKSGTSHAAPMVSACIAALRQAAPDASADEVEAALEQTGVARIDAKNGRTYPRIDCAGALEVLAPGAGTSDDDGGSDDDAGLVPDGGSGNDAGAVDAATGTGGDAATPADAAADGADGGDAAAGAAGADAATPPDAGGNAGAPDPRDAAIPADASLHLRGGADGCNCATSSSAALHDASVPFALAALLLRRRRRRLER